MSRLNSKGNKVMMLKDIVLEKITVVV